MRKLYFFLIAFSLILAVNSFAQEKKLEPWQYGHWLSAEEMNQKLDLKSFVETAPPTAPVRNIAEFDRMQGALVRYPFGIPLALVKEMSNHIMVTTIVLNSTQQATVTSQYQSAGVNMANTSFLLAPTDSYWTRDYGPWFESDSSNHIGIVDFPYNRPRPNDDEIPKKVAAMMGIPWFGMNVIHTGGNYMTDGLGISSSTTLVWNENPTQTHDSIAVKMHNYLGIDNYLVEEDPNGTYIDHIDCWGKFLAPDKILIRKVPPSHPQYAQIEATAAFYAATPCSYGYNYKVYRVNTPNDQPYTNSVILNNNVYVPTMNSSWDDSALAAYQAAMPGYTIYGMLGAPATPWESTDALHCRVMGLADVGQLYIAHIPLSGNVPAQDNFLLTADLINCSDSAVYSDSVLIWYRVNSGSYKKTSMVNITGSHYAGYIPKQPAGSVIQYYLYAADKSGHNAVLPFMGPADPFTFTAIYTDITAVPDTLYFETYNDAYYGKTAWLHNYTGSGINMTSMDSWGAPSGGSGLWNVNPFPFTSFPSMINAGDSVPVHVVFVVGKGSANGYFIDTLAFATQLGQHRIILMINDTLDLSLLAGNTKGRTPLLANYPNPFSGSTTVRYEVPVRTPVRIEVMNTFGNTVAVLVDEEKEAGTWSVSFAAGGLPSGVYYCRMITGSSSVMTKMVVTK